MSARGACHSFPGFALSLNWINPMDGPILESIWRCVLDLPADV